MYNFSTCLELDLNDILDWPYDQTYRNFVPFIARSVEDVHVGPAPGAGAIASSAVAQRACDFRVSLALCSKIVTFIVGAPTP